MADGSIAIAITVDGKEVDVASKSLDGLGKQSQTTTRGIKDMVVSFGLVKVASAAFDVLKSSISAATDRFDEFQKFPKVMSALGFSADESKSSIDKLSNGIEGLPTRLNDVVSQTRQLTAITGDLSKSTDTVLALNNAFLASGRCSSILATPSATMLNFRIELLSMNLIPQSDMYNQYTAVFKKNNLFNCIFTLRCLI